MSAPQLVVLPGDTLGLASKSHPGNGTHIAGRTITAALAGTRTTTTPTLTTVTSPPTRPPPARLPTLNALVLARVTRLRPREAHLAIHVVDGVPAPEPFAGVLRAQDVRATERERVRVLGALRVGDAVRARVVGLGDERSYFLGTGRDELGVLLATSEGGLALAPVSWDSMRDAEGRVEGRKVARPD